MSKKKRRFEWTTRPDGKKERWEFRSDISLGIIKKEEAQKYPHLRRRMRWVITEVKEKWERT